MAPSMGSDPFLSSPDTIYKLILQRHLASLGRTLPPPPSQFYSGSSIYTTVQLGSLPYHPAGPTSSRDRVLPSHSQTITGPSPQLPPPWVLQGQAMQLITHSPSLPTARLAAPVLNQSPPFLGPLCFLTLPGTSSGIADSPRKYRQRRNLVVRQELGMDSLVGN